MSNRNMDTKLVYDAAIGYGSVHEIWWGNKQLFPANELLAHSVLLEMPKEGTEDAAYFRRAFEVVEEQSGKDSFIKLEFGDGNYVYWVNKKLSALPMASLTPKGMLTFSSDEGVPVQDLKPGRHVKIIISIPKTSSQEFYTPSSTIIRDVPLLIPGTSIWSMSPKGTRKTVSGANISLQGVPSEHTHYNYHWQQNGHGRWDTWNETTQNGAVPGSSADGYNPYINPKFIPTDTHSKLTLSGHHGNPAYAQVKYPAFTLVRFLKIKGVTAQKN